MASIQFHVCLLILGIWASQATSRTLHETSMLESFEQWMTLHGRVYSGASEKERRFEIYKENVQRIESSNKAGNRSYMLSVNKFADQTNEEFTAARNGYRGLCSSTKATFRYENVSAVPSSIDWRKKGAVTPIKDQGQCGKKFNHITASHTVLHRCHSKNK